MKRRWTGFLAAVVILVSSCLPALSTIAAEKEETASRAAAYTAGMERKQADYTVIYTARDGENETVLAKEIFRAPVGETVNIQHKDFKNYAREAGQDMTILVTADGRAVKKVYYTRLFYDRIVFRTEGTYISPIYGWAGRDISDDIAKIKDPVWPGYVFRGWDREIPSVMPEGEYVINALWEPGESRYTVLRWMENAEDEGYTLLGDTEVRTAQTGTVVTASQADIDRAGIMADWFPDSDYYKDYYGFDYARCEDVEVTADGRAVLNLYYDREIWTINLHEEAAHESEASDSLVPNDDIWYTAQGKYGAPLPDDFPTMEEMEAYYMGKTQFQDVQFLGVRDEFEAVSRHLDTFYFQDLAVGNHTFDAYPWLERDSYPVYVTYLKESADGRFRKVRVESAQVDKNPAVYGAEITVLHPKGLTCEGGWYTTGNSVEECEQKEKIPISGGQILSDGKCVFRNVGSHLFVYLKRDTFTLNYIDGRNDGESIIYRKEKVTYRDKVSLEYRPEQGEEHSGDWFAGWYLSPALTDSGNPLTVLRIPAQDVNVYAGWYPAEWSVRFEVQGEVEVPGEQIVLDGTLAEIPQEPEREGHIFLGWFSDPGETDVRQAWDFWRPVESDITLYAGWHPVGDTVYTVRHVIEGESDPFYEAAGTGKSGDIIFVRPLYISDEGYPSDQYLETESVGKKITLKQNEDNIITFTYKKTDAEGEETLPDSGREELDSDTTDKGAKPGSGDAGDMPDTGDDDIIPDTGNRAYPHRVILTMAAALCLAAGMALWRKSISGSL
ncbi:InlB B-repeat-containing protein [Mediterraneibacter glycyrrhizinilyticus]|uniref:InlB B-repeat-containing protein n=1 Tax=Mediterraneibacter glycyrrhizinilyticus TaxID=342942 RepID=UPI0025AAA0F2|nr:InlB B-repeat-containing protein [Mediterraneibacter glycyrrhizinilyticus]MDN0062206.1 InlB B-repeat-containing protein [Mediterraneibacter glycyrrhizinilyticus]